MATDFTMPVLFWILGDAGGLYVLASFLEYFGF